MSRLVLTNDLLDRLRRELLNSSHETCAILYGRAIIHSGAIVRMVVREYQTVSDDDYTVRNEVAAQLKPEVVAGAAAKSRETGDSIVFVHTHPFPMNRYSEIDDAGETALAEFLNRRTPGVAHATLLLTPEVVIARVLGTSEKLLVVGIGKELQWGDSPTVPVPDAAFDRQIRAFGAKGQEILSRLKIGIVGLGGTGSVTLEQLAHLGVGSFLLIDPDIVERTNLNRLIGASESDIGKEKVAVAKRLAQRINPGVRVDAIVGSVLLSKTADELTDTDFIFCCTDSHGSRAVLNQLAYQYLVPTIDMGVVIICENNKVAHVGGRVQMLAPGLGCLLCGNILNPEAVRIDLLTEYERNADPYIVGFREPAPAVISLNTTVAALSVTMFLAAVTGFPADARLINYNGTTGTARAAVMARHPQCVACSTDGALSRANEWPLPARLS